MRKTSISSANYRRLELFSDLRSAIAAIYIKKKYVCKFDIVMLKYIINSSSLIRHSLYTRLSLGRWLIYSQ